MSTIPTNPALEAAIVAAADEDTPRLAYADWLDEHGDPDRAEFIRVQCRLADLSPADPDWVDLTERQDELVARLKPRYLGLELDLPDRFYFGTDLIGRYEEPFRRGFAYFVSCRTRGPEWTPEETARVAADLTRLVRTTTARGFQPFEMPANRLAQLLATPAVAELTGLAVTPHVTSDYRRESTAFYRALVASPAVRKVRHLALYGGVMAEGVTALAKADTLGAVRRATINGFEASSDALKKLLAADWFSRLRHFRTHLMTAPVAPTMLRGLGDQPDLHTLDLPHLAGPAVSELQGEKFRALARLIFDGGLLDRDGAAALARCAFPRLAVFEAWRRNTRNDAFAELLKADWLARLRVLNLCGNAVGDKGIAALAAHPAAKSLRVVRLGDNPFGKTGLAAIAKPGAFPDLTTLDLGSSLKRKAVEADVVKFVAALGLPRLRHLNLQNWPLGNAGAKALAGNPALAGLTRLNLYNCRIADPGAKALLASPHLRNLVELDLSDNAIRTGADALADPGVMPRLAECRLGGNKIPKASAARIDRDNRYVSI